MPLFPVDATPTSSLQMARLLCTHFGFLSLENLKKFTPVEDNARFRRSIKDLDKISGYVMKKTKREERKGGRREGDTNTNRKKREKRERRGETGIE